MKTITLWKDTEQVSLSSNKTAPFEFDARKILADLLSQSSAGGYTIGQMRTRIDLLNKLEMTPTHADSGTSQIDLSDEERLLLKEKIESTKWAYALKNIIKLSDALS